MVVRSHAAAAKRLGATADHAWRGGFPAHAHAAARSDLRSQRRRLFLLELAVALTAAGLADLRAQAEALGDAFVAAGGFWGSVNHDTYDRTTRAWPTRALSASCAVLRTYWIVPIGASSPTGPRCPRWHASVWPKIATGLPRSACCGWRKAGTPPICGRTGRGGASLSRSVGRDRR